MSPSKLKSLLTGVLVAMFVAVGGSVVAQDGLRLFKPYDPESFGGSRRSNDGVYGSVSGIIWSFSTPKDGYIGATTANGKDETRWVYDSRKVFAQTNSAKINMMDATTSLGTRFEVGNRRGHHGWLFSGYNLPSQGHRMTVQNITMAIRDEGNLTMQLMPQDAIGWGGTPFDLPSTIYVWDRVHNSLYDPLASSNSQYYPFAEWQVKDGLTLGTISGIGYLWGSYLFGSIDANACVIAPLPIWFKNVDITVNSSHYSAELMYTYRAHPFTWGTMELLAGARYWDFKDKFGFNGRGPDSTGTTVDGTNVDRDLGPVSVLADMTVDAVAHNRVFGPQVGLKLDRQNARWTFGAEGRFTAGINSQAVKTQGYIATNYDYASNYWISTQIGQSHGNDTTVNGSGIYQTDAWVPIGLQFNNTNFGHAQTKTYFSPVLEGRLSADWQWTSAVSFFGAVNGMYAGNIARGVRVTDYVVKSDGTIFGIRGNDRNTDVFIYGVEAGIKVKR